MVEKKEDKKEKETEKVEAVLDELLDPKRQEQMSINLKKLSHPNANAEIVDLIEALL